VEERVVFLRMLRRSLDAVLVSMKRRSESMSESARRFSMVHVLANVTPVLYGLFRLKKKKKLAHRWDVMHAK